MHRFYPQISSLIGRGPDFGPASAQPSREMISESDGEGQQR